MTLSHLPDSRLSLLSARPAVTFPAEERHRPSTGSKLYCLLTEAHAYEQLAQGCYLEADRPRFEPTTFWVASECSYCYATQVTSDWLRGHSINWIEFWIRWNLHNDVTVVCLHWITLFTAKKPFNFPSESETGYTANPKPVSTIEYSLSIHSNSICQKISKKEKLLSPYRCNRCETVCFFRLRNIKYSLLSKKFKMAVVQNLPSTATTRIRWAQWWTVNTQFHSAVAAADDRRRTKRYFTRDSFTSCFESR